MDTLLEGKRDLYGILKGYLLMDTQWILKGYYYEGKDRKREERETLWVYFMNT